MKISPAISVNKKFTAISDFWPPNGKEGSQNWDPVDAATPTLWLPRSWGDGGSKVNKEIGLAQVAEVHMKEMNSVSPEACIFPNTDCSIP